MKTLVLISLISALGFLCVALTSSPAPEDAEFEDFIAKYGVNYATDTELDFRRAIFKQNMVRAKQLDELNPYAKFGITIFSDRTREEMKQRMGAIDFRTDETHAKVFELTAKPTSSIDWKKYMKPIQDQGTSCGSCWAFSAIASLEGRYQKKYGKIEKLSEQQALDCTSKSYGCNGGWYDDFWKYAEKNPICDASDYKYVHRKGACKTCYGSITTEGSTLIRNNEEAMYAALKDGPISIAVDGEDWPYYQSGVITNCGTHMDHSAVIVGYQKKEDAWVVRNSWGKAFGEDGHIRLKYGQNTCLVTYKPAFPDV
ncbi:unnamed protein product [Moneuplotes crassus]|uniref:Uncharacterized protein n=1 Tax=Euplotes crassus TaxID=5936 RepID=A0AAD1UH25_EUPCR|nr:unnamed protein product [Moneuplotes crassus]